MADRAYFFANWKMNMITSEAVSYISKFQTELSERDQIRNALFSDKVKVAFFPSFTSLSTIREELRTNHLYDKVSLGAQNVFYEQQGAFTGEISCMMLSELSCQYAIVGHSERRHIFGESDIVVRKKVDSCLKNRIKPVICVGESLAERDDGRTFSVIETQLAHAIEGLSLQDVESSIILAYEPIWAIGTGRAASASDAEEVCQYIRKKLIEHYDAKIASEVPILYGGSVKPVNTAILLSQPDIDGALIGGASLKADTFLNIVGSYLSSVKVK